MLPSSEHRQTARRRGQTLHVAATPTEPTAAISGEGYACTTHSASLTSTSVTAPRIKVRLARVSVSRSHPRQQANLSRAQTLSEGPHRRRKLAERGGFEPPVQCYLYTGLANRPYRPLRHLSESRRLRKEPEGASARSFFAIQRLSTTSVRTVELRRKG